VKGRRVTHHALARLQQAENLRSELFTNDPNVAGDGSSWSGPSKEWRRDAPGFRAPRLPGSKIVWEVHYHAVGETITDSVELGVFLSEGPEAEASRSPGAVQHLQRTAHDARHSSESGDDDRKLRHAEGERPHREFPGAHAPARQRHVDGGALPGRPARC
jgi:hypothetical protein